MGTIFRPELHDGRGPKYRKLFNALHQAIRTGDLPAGFQLPPVRALAWDIGVTPGTVARAYQLARDEGLIAGSVGRGTFVRGKERAADTPPENALAHPIARDRLNFRIGHVIELGQGAIIRDMIAELVAHADLDLTSYVPDSALAPCRNHATEWLNANGVRGDAGDLVLTHGAHSAVMVAMNAVLHGREPVIATTDLIYPGFRQTAHLCRARMVGVPSDDEGIRPDLLDAVCRDHAPQALLISSNVHNPTCVATPLDRRHAIAEIARRYDVQIIEDDVYGSLIDRQWAGFTELCPERCWHATSLSKCLAAGLRIGFLLCPPGQGPHGLKMMQGLSLSISQLLSMLVARLFADGVVADFAPRIASENAARMAIAMQTLSRWPVSGQPGVSYVWLRDPEGWAHGTFGASIEAAGIQIAQGANFSLPGAQPPNAVRLTLSGIADRDAMRSALQRIDRILLEPPESLLA